MNKFEQELKNQKSIQENKGFIDESAINSFKEFIKDFVEVLDRKNIKYNLTDSMLEVKTEEKVKDWRTIIYDIASKREEVLTVKGFRITSWYENKFLLYNFHITDDGKYDYYYMFGCADSNNIINYEGVLNNMKRYHKELYTILLVE